MSLPEPITRKEQYYDGIARGNASKLPEPITREEQYLEYIAKNGGGGGGGTTDYEALDNKPSINSVELSGNKTLDDLNIQGKLTFDNEPTEDSQNPVKSGGVYEALESLDEAISSKPDEYADLTDKPSINSVELSGNKTASELGLQDELDGAQTVSGNPITVADAEPMNAESVVVELEPKQDLHGYDAPWVGGAGKNKLDTSQVTISDITFTPDANGYVTASPNNSDPRAWTYASAQYKESLPAGNYKVVIETKTETSSGAAGLNVINGSGTSIISQNPFSAVGIVAYNFTLTSVTEIAIMAKMYSASARFMIVAQTESNDFEPYSNICPISGYSEVEVERVGKNLLPMTVDGIKSANTSGTWSGNTYTLNGVTFEVLTDSANNVEGIKADGTKTSSGAVTFWIYDSLSTSIIPDGTSVTLNGCPAGGAVNEKYSLRVVASDYSGAMNDLGDGVTFTFNNSWRFAYIDVWETIVSDLTFYPMIRLATDSADFEPYQGDTYTIDLDGTRYGGTLDVTNGVLTVDRGYYKVTNDTNVEKNASGWHPYYPSYYISVDPLIMDDVHNVVVISNMMEGVPREQIQGLDSVYVCSMSAFGHEVDFTSDLDNASDVKQLLIDNNCEFCYKLATPLTIQLTPTQIQMLENTNNISTNATNIQLKYQPNNVIGECKAYTDEEIEKVLPQLPTTDGTYHLSCEVTSGVGVLSWVSDS